LNIDEGRALNESVSNLMKNDLNVVVYNFVDMLSHARTDMQMIRELASDDAAYRSLTLSWFEHSPLFDLLEVFGSKTSTCGYHYRPWYHPRKKPKQNCWRRNTNTNLRYKQGKNLTLMPRMFSISATRTMPCCPSCT
jgi:hypothetical protein